MPYFNIVAQTNEYILVTKYVPAQKCAELYQSKAELKKEFIRMLRRAGSFLSALAQRYKGFNHAVQGPLWFAYHGERLSDLCNRLGK